MVQAILGQLIHNTAISAAILTNYSATAVLLARTDELLAGVFQADIRQEIAIIVTVMDGQQRCSYTVALIVVLDFGDDDPMAIRFLQTQFQPDQIRSENRIMQSWL